MSQTLVKLAADFNTTLSLKVAVGDTTATLTSATDDDGVALPTGTYGLTLDRKSSSKEYIQCTLTGTALTAIYSVSRQGVRTSGFARTHRKGAEVIISDFSALKRINDVLDGAVNLDASTPLGYDGTATISTANQLATKAYVDGIAIAGSPDATTSTKGIGRVSVAPVSAAIPIFVGDNDGRVPTQGENDSLVGNNTDVAVGTGNKMVTQTGLQHNAEKYVLDTSGSSTAYVAVLSPLATSLTTGMVIYIKIVNANTTTTPTLTLTGTATAKTIVKGTSTALAVGDIGANSFNTLIYDGTNMVLQNPTNVSIITPTKINVTTTDVTTTATTADVLTASVPANTLGTNGGVFGEIYFSWASASGTAKQVLLKYGAATVATISMTPDSTSGVTMFGYIKFMLLANAATNAQEGSIWCFGSAANTFRTSTITNIIMMQGSALGTSAQDSTGALNLVISIAQNAGAADTFTMSHGFVKNI